MYSIRNSAYFQNVSALLQSQRHGKRLVWILFFLSRPSASYHQTMSVDKYYDNSLERRHLCLLLYYWLYTSAFDKLNLKKFIVEKFLNAKYLPDFHVGNIGTSRKYDALRVSELWLSHMLILHAYQSFYTYTTFQVFIDVNFFSLVVPLSM